MSKLISIYIIALGVVIVGCAKSETDKPTQVTTSNTTAAQATQKADKPGMKAQQPRKAMINPRLNPNAIVGSKTK
jgi:PBP1b-binding outer membrane lipoprotein LpoB